MKNFLEITLNNIFTLLIILILLVSSLVNHHKGNEVLCFLELISGGILAIGIRLGIEFDKVHKRLTDIENNLDKT